MYIYTEGVQLYYNIILRVVVHSHLHVHVSVMYVHTACTYLAGYALFLWAEPGRCQVTLLVMVTALVLGW